MTQTRPHTKVGDLTAKEKAAVRQLLSCLAAVLLIVILIVALLIWLL